MKENKLKHIDGKKIRRQYCNAPLIFLYTVMLAIPYAIFVISWGIGKLDPSDWPSTLWMSIWVCFVFSVPFLLLRILNTYCFGRIICVLTEEGIHYPKGMLRWETIEKIEYAIDTKPRYKSDSGKSFRLILFTRGGKHVVLDKSPLRILSQIKKYRPEPDVRISGVTSLLSPVLIMTAIIVLCPLYLVLLIRAPGASVPQLVVMAVIWLILGLVRIPVFDAYDVRYRFWRPILPRKWLAYTLLGVYYASFFAAILAVSYFPNWVVVSLLGIYLGVVQPPVPSKRGSSRVNRILSYEQLYEIYITQADFWEKNMEKNREARSKRKK